MKHLIKRFKSPATTMQHRASKTAKSETPSYRSTGFWTSSAPSRPAPFATKEGTRKQIQKSQAKYAEQKRNEKAQAAASRTKYEKLLIPEEKDSDTSWVNDGLTAAAIATMKAQPEVMYSQMAANMKEHEEGKKTKKSLLPKTMPGFGGTTPSVNLYDQARAIGNDDKKVTFEDVKNDPEFFQYLYSSGGKDAPWYRQVANVLNVGGNYINGMLNPDGETLMDWGEGTERQAVANALWNQYYNGHSTINDSGHAALGGLEGGTQHSGEEFRITKNANGEDQSFREKIGNQIKMAAHAPYHNIYGQSSDARFTDNGFESVGDNYTFNNIWSESPNANGQPTVSEVIGDGEGTLGLLEAIVAGSKAYGGLKPKMETAASLRGVNTTRHTDVTNISQEDLDKWAQEYIKHKK